MLGTNNRSEVFSSRRNDPEPAGAGGIDVAKVIDFQAIPGVLARLNGCVEKERFVRKRPVRLDVITENDFFLLVPIVDIEIFLIGREREPVRACQISADEFKLAVDQAIDAAEGKLLTRIVEELRQAEGRVGKVQRAVGAIHEIVRAVEALALVAIGEDGQLAVLLKPGNAAIPVFVDSDAVFGVEGQSVRTGLPVFADVGSRISTVRAIDGNAVVFRPAVNQVVVGIAEEKVTTVAHPDRTFCELESA